MLLTEFPNVVFDELPQRADPKKVYFLSRPICNTAQYNEDNKILIFTTEEIRTFMRHSTKSISGRYIAVITDHVFTLNGRQIRVDTIKTGSACGNVMYLLSYTDQPNKMTLYAGKFNEFGNIFSNKYLKAAIKNQSIANVYIDNTLASADNGNSVSVAADAINQIRKSNPLHKIYLWADRVGCENLLSVLSTVHKLKVYVNSTRRHLLRALGIMDQFCVKMDTADILVLEEGTKYRLESFSSAYVTKKLINMRLITTEKQVASIGSANTGIVYIPYASHPSAELLMILLNRVQPEKVFKTAEFHGLCSEIPVPLLSRLSVEDANADALFEDALVQIDYTNFDHSIGGEENEQAKQRSFLDSRNSEDNWSHSDEIRAVQSNESEPCREANKTNEPEPDLIEVPLHCEDDGNMIGNAEADEQNASNIPINDSESDRYGYIQEARKASKKLMKTDTDPRAEKKKRKSSEIDASECTAKTNRRKEAKRIQYISSSSSSSGCSSSFHGNNMCDRASNGTLSIHSSASSDINPNY